jgi:tRNA-specific 2-thiouridylase
MKKRVVVGLSGGVDSSVAAHILQQQGFEVLGLFMKNWHDESVVLANDCPWIDDSNDALLVAEMLHIPFQVIDLSAEYKSRIVDYMFAEYEKGRTPNPDVLCNREIKFDVFLDAALKLGADFVATGHYCRKIEHADGNYGLLAGLDKNKDQSYFLCQLNQFQLSKALFPIGNLQKAEVRNIAKQIQLPTAEKKDSQGLCFVGKISLPTFLQQSLKIKEGNIIEIEEYNKKIKAYHNIEPSIENVERLCEPFHFTEEEGIIVGKHQGAHFYTVGQRKGLHIGGRPLPSFAIEINTHNNLVFSGQGETHLGLHRWALKIESNNFHLVNKNIDIQLNIELSFLVRIRYRQALQVAKLIKKDDAYYVLFEKAQKSITPGQFIAFYIGDELVASGVIAH